MTHEYVIALNGAIEPRVPDAPRATAVGWAADAVLAVGSDAVVRAISRGDSTFLDLGGCVVTPLPTDIERAQALIRASDPDTDIGRLLVEAGLLPPDAGIEPGAPADLAMWDRPRTRSPGSEQRLPFLLARVRGGHFVDGDEHRGPFPEPGPA